MFTACLRFLSLPHWVRKRICLRSKNAGERNPVRLAQLARGKIRQLGEALDCSFLTSEHVIILAMMLAAIR